MSNVVVFERKDVSSNGNRVVIEKNAFDAQSETAEFIAYRATNCETIRDEITVNDRATIFSPLPVDCFQWQQQQQQQRTEEADNDDDGNDESNESDHRDADDTQDGGKKATSFLGTVMHMLIVGMSPTLLAVPSAFSRVGYAVGVCGAFGTVALYAHCMHMIVDTECALLLRRQRRDRRTRRAKMSYTQIVHDAFATGPRTCRWMAAYVKCALCVTLVLIWTGSNAIYALIISENIGSTVRQLGGGGGGGGHHQIADDRSVLLYLVVPLVLLCWMPNLRTLVFFSTFSNVVNVCSIAIIVGTAAVELPAAPRHRTSVGDLAQIPYFLAVVLTTVNGTGLLMSLKNQMRTPKRFRSRFGVLNVSYTIVASLYAFFGCVCYLRYGPQTTENVILNLPRNTFAGLVNALFALAVIFFYPLVAYVTFDIGWNELLRPKLQRTSRRYRSTLKYALKTATALSSVALAYAFPSAPIFLSLSGNVCTALDSIILPAVIDTLVHCHTARPYYAARAIKNVLIVAVGVSCAIAGLFDSIRQLRHFYDSSAYT